MRTVDAVADVRGFGKSLEAVQETRRHIQVPKVSVVEQKHLLSAERWRALSDVDQHIVDRAARAADELRFAVPGSSVHAPDRALDGTGLGILHEGSGGPRSAEMVVEDVGVKGSGKKPTVVVVRLRDEDENVHEVSRFDTHLEMLS